MTTNLDTTFGSPNGFVTTDFLLNTPAENFGYSIVIQPDGKIVMAGDTLDSPFPIGTGLNIVAISRYNTDGSLDVTFGLGGKTTAVIGSDNILCSSVTLQPDLKIVVCGTYYASFKSFFVARFTSSGSLDNTFGGGFGYVITNASTFSQGQGSGPGSIVFDNCEAYSIAIQSNNKIVVGGNVRDSSSGQHYFALARYLLVASFPPTAGNLDATFGNGSSINGTAVKIFNPLNEYFLNSIVIDNNNKIIVGGKTRLLSPAGNFNFAVARFNINGPVDTGFGTNGITVVSNFSIGSTDESSSVKLNSNGDIILAGTSITLTNHFCFAIAKFDSTGAIYTSFGTNGKVTTNLSTFSIKLTCNSMAIQSDNKIILGGSFTNLASIPNQTDSFALARYNTDGSLDTTFGLTGNGLILQDIVAYPDKEVGNSIAIQTDGKILVGGTISTFNDGAPYDFILARYLYNYPTPPIPPIPPTPPTPPTPLPVAPICFPAGTPVTTDQGDISIEELDPNIHTINTKPIIGVTKTVMNNDRIVCIEKDSFGFNMPNKKTYISNEHGIMYNRKLTKASYFVGKLRGIYYKKYDGEVLYNILMEKHYLIYVNGLKVETLNPKNIIAKLYTNKYTQEEKIKLIQDINEYSKHKFNNCIKQQHNYNNYGLIQHNKTRRNYEVYKYSPLISKIHFHTKKNYSLLHKLQQQTNNRNNYYNNRSVIQNHIYNTTQNHNKTIKQQISFAKNNQIYKVKTHTYSSNRRRR